MKKIALLVMSVVTALCAASCELFEDPVLSVNPQSAEFGSSSGSVSITVSSSKEWEASTDGSDWVSLSKTTGEKGDSQVRVSVKSNETYDNRSATITFKSASKKLNPVSIRIVQAKKEAFILDGDVTFNLPEGGGDITVKVETNMTYKISYSNGAETWISESKTKALSSYSHSFTIAANTSLLERKGTIYFTDQNNRQYAVTVNQEGMHQYLSVTHGRVRFVVPKLAGKNISGVVEWGDGAQENYKNGLIHEYADSSQHTVTLDVKGATGVTINNIEGVTTIDFTKFKD
jgi:hypothetical protein